MRKILEQCPTCGEALEITRLTCNACDTVIHGHYEPCRFCRLTPEELRLFDSFVKCRGNVKEMERDLGMSYWTVRGQLDQLIQSIGFEPGPESEPDSEEAVTDIETERLHILEQLDQGELTVTEATRQLGQLSSSE